MTQVTLLAMPLTFLEPKKKALGSHHDCGVAHYEEQQGDAATGLIGDLTRHEWLIHGRKAKGAQQRQISHFCRRR
jgi:hypothetical protein